MIACKRTVPEMRVWRASADNRLNAVDDARCLNVAAYAKRAISFGFGGQALRHATDDATEYAPMTRNAAWNATLMPVDISGSASS